MKNAVDPAKMLSKVLSPLGFVHSIQEGQHTFRRPASDAEFLQEIVLNSRKFDETLSISIAIAITAQRVLGFVKEHAGSDMAAVATVGGNFAQIRSAGTKSGWDIPNNEDGTASFSEIAEEIATIGIELLDKLSNYDALTEICLQELSAPGSAALGIRHVFELPAILYLTGQTKACRESIEKAEEKLLQFIKREELPVRMPEHHRFLRAVASLLAGSA